MLVVLIPSSAPISNFPLFFYLTFCGGVFPSGDGYSMLMIPTDDLLQFSAGEVRLPRDVCHRYRLVVRWWSNVVARIIVGLVVFWLPTLLWVHWYSQGRWAEVLEHLFFFSPFSALLCLVSSCLCFWFLCRGVVVPFLSVFFFLFWFPSPLCCSCFFPCFLIVFVLAFPLSLRLLGLLIVLPSGRLISQAE